MNELSRPACIPDGWTQPSKSLLRESRSADSIKDNIEKAYRARLDNSCRDQLSNAEAVMNLIESILHPVQRTVFPSPFVSFVINPQGFWWHNEKNVPVLIHQDPEKQIDI